MRLDHNFFCVEPPSKPSGKGASASKKAKERRKKKADGEGEEEEDEELAVKYYKFVLSHYKAARSIRLSFNVSPFFFFCHRLLKRKVNIVIIIKNNSG